MTSLAALNPGLMIFSVERFANKASGAELYSAPDIPFTNLSNFIAGNRDQPLGWALTYYVMISGTVARVDQ